MLSMSANAMLGQTAFEGIKQSHLNSLGKDVNWVGAMVDIGIAGALGGSLGGIGHLSGLASKIKSLDGDLHDQNMSVALTAVGDGKNVDNMRVIDPDDSATISPSKLDDSDPLLERQTKQQGHEQSFNDKNEIDTVETTFNTDTGKIVLDDLKKRSHFFNTTHVKGDSHESAYYEGQRSLVVFIESLLNHKE